MEQAFLLPVYRAKRRSPLMKAIRIVRSLGPIDWKSVRRDSMLRWMIFIPLLAALVLRIGAPALANFVMDAFAFDLPPYYPLLMSFIAVAMPMIYGAIIGFLVLDQRDDNTITALQVTPLTLSGYLGYRVALPTLLGVLVTLFVVPVSGLVQMNVFDLLLVALAGAPFAALTALYLAAFAENKVQGFALMKGGGVIFLPVVLAYFVESGWQILFGLIPLYWPVRLFWALEAGQPHTWFYFLVSLVYQAGIV
jgi:fluoroquinolone transport system permease protein